VVAGRGSWCLGHFSEGVDVGEAGGVGGCVRWERGIGRRRVDEGLVSATVRMAVIAVGGASREVPSRMRQGWHFMSVVRLYCICE
jgi:hypothetical protein